MISIFGILNFPPKITKKRDNRKIPENQLYSNRFWHLTAPPCFEPSQDFTTKDKKTANTSFRISVDISSYVNTPYLAQASISPHEELLSIPFNEKVVFHI